MQQKLITEQSYSRFVYFLNEALELGGTLVPGSLQKWDVVDDTFEQSELFPVITTKYIAVIENK